MTAEHEGGILLICDKGFAGREFETLLGEYGITMLRPSRKDEKARAGEPLLKKVRQLIESHSLHPRETGGLPAFPRDYRSR